MFNRYRLPAISALVLMLFLAVFCGFLAENFREHQVEHQREKQYIKSFIEDLKSDTTFINLYINSKATKKKMNDSLIWYLNAPVPFGVPRPEGPSQPARAWHHWVVGQVPLLPLVTSNRLPGWTYGVALL